MCDSLCVVLLHVSFVFLICCGVVVVGGCCGIGCGVSCSSVGCGVIVACVGVIFVCIVLYLVELSDCKVRVFDRDLVRGNLSEEEEEEEEEKMSGVLVESLFDLHLQVVECMSVVSEVELSERVRPLEVHESGVLL